MNERTLFLLKALTKLLGHDGFQLGCDPDTGQVDFIALTVDEMNDLLGLLATAMGSKHPYPPSSDLVASAEKLRASPNRTAN